MERTKPPFRAEHVGSLIRPAALIDAREKARKKEISDAELERIQHAQSVRWYDCKRSSGSSS
jgi:5-methyltetrahydropteroyltriglutamate--homocysteine methyltransferase